MLRAVLVMLLVPTFAMAQQQSPPSEQALGQKLMQEIQAGISCSVNVINLQQELAKVQAELKALKLEEKK